MATGLQTLKTARTKSTKCLCLDYNQVGGVKYLSIALQLLSVGDSSTFLSAALQNADTAPYPT